MLAGNAVLLWQFDQARGQADRLGGVDEELITVLQAHADLLTLYERLDALAHSENTAQLLKEVEEIRGELQQESLRTRNALSRLPQQVQLDPTVVPTLVTIEDSLPAELQAMSVLAKSGEWD